MHHIDFKPRPVSHAPSPFGFGFGLGSGPPTMVAPGGWQPSTSMGHTNVAAFQQLASSINQTLKPMKRGRDSEDDTDSRDESMDRSPTPERPKRAPPKRARVINATTGSERENTTNADKKDSGNGQEDVDVGVLLASLPLQMLLPLLTSLLKAQPDLKSKILELIPRPTLQTALEALDQSAKKLREAYPYSNVPSFSPDVSFAFGSQSSSHSSQLHQPQGGMRDSYIVSRLRPAINDFAACCMSYLPYFSSISTPTQTTSGAQLTHAIQAMHKDQFHPSETFLFLQAITNHLIPQPPLTISSMGPLLIPRLMEEWQSWVDKIDEVVNRQAGMFGSETVRSWEKALDDMAGAKASEISTPMRLIRDRWIGKVGWLVGRAQLGQRYV